MKKPARALFEGRWIFLTLGIVWIVSFQLHLHLGMVFAAAMIVFSLWFFRDPERVSPADPLLAVSPADGTVTLVEEVIGLAA